MRLGKGKYRCLPPFFTCKCLIIDEKKKWKFQFIDPIYRFIGFHPSIFRLIDQIFLHPFTSSVKWLIQIEIIDYSEPEKKEEKTRTVKAVNEGDLHWMCVYKVNFVVCFVPSRVYACSWVLPKNWFATRKRNQFGIFFLDMKIGIQFTLCKFCV